MTAAPELSVALSADFARELPELACRWQADDVSEPHLVLLNEPLAAQLGWDAAWLRSAQGVRFLVGNAVTDGARPVAQVYAGHQFGGYTPRLGDGRALLLGEVVDVQGQVRDVHLKGSGRTPLARGGDGLAAIGPMLREYVVSEAMHALGIPSTRSLAVVATGRWVRRETSLPGAVLTRIASSHLRVGSFQYAAATGDPALLRRLADHAMSRHYPAAAHADLPYLALLKAVIAAQASTVARWMLVGFVHGVMNTDNMTISGETIDYGPCAFLDAYDPATVYSSIDEGGRYSYGNQPMAARWNLTRLAETLLPLIHEDPDQAVDLAQDALDGFSAQYDDAWSTGMHRKLGLPTGHPDVATSLLITDLLTLLGEGQVDYTSFFRAVAVAAAVDGDTAPSRSLFAVPAEFDRWVQRWRALLPDARVMNQANPLYIPRNHLLEPALTAATQGDYQPIEQLLDAVRLPYQERPGLQRYADSAPPTFSAAYRTFCGT